MRSVHYLWGVLLAALLLAGCPVKPSTVEGGATFSYDRPTYRQVSVIQPSYPEDVPPVVSPSSLAITEDRYYLADYARARIVVFDREGNFIEQFGNGEPIAPYEISLDEVPENFQDDPDLPPELEEWHEQRSFFRASTIRFFNGRLYVLNDFYSSATEEPLYAPSVWVFTPEGEFVEEIDLGNSEGPFMDVSEETVVTAGGRSLNVETISLGNGNALGSAGTDQNYLSSLASLENVTETRRQAYLEGMTNSGTGDGQFGGTMGQVDIFRGKVLAADPGNQRIQLFRLDMSYLQSLPGFDKGQLRYRTPLLIEVSPEGEIFVYDGNAERFSLLGPDFNLNYYFGADKVTEPPDMQYVDDMGLVVVDTSGNLHVFKKSTIDPETGEVTPVEAASGGGGGEPASGDQ